MKVLLYVIGTALFAISASAFPTAKSNIPSQCGDPTFACQDLVNARLCGVVKTCIHDIWATMSVPDDNDEVCDICKEMVKEARDQLLSNMTQEEIKEVFEGSCKLLPIKFVADECIKVVDEIIPQLVEMLASRMDPSMVCTVSGMCFATHLPSEERPVLKLAKMVLAAHNDDQCTQCVTMITDVQTFMKSSSEEDVKNAIEALCAQKVEKYLCDMVISTYFPSFYTFILSTDAKALCSSIGICPKKCEVKDVIKINDELTCEFCDHVLHHIKDLMTTNTTMEEFRTALLNFCKHVGSFSDKCTSLVNDYYDMLFDYIKNLDTKGVCTVLGLCNNNETCAQVPLIKIVPALETKKRIPMMKLLPASLVVPKDLSVSPLVKLVPANVATKNQMIETNDIFPLLPVEKFSHPLSVFEKDTECAFCKAISFYIQQDLNGDKSKEGVRSALDQVCDKWVKDFPDQCNIFMKKNSMKIQESIAKGVEFEKVCAYSKVCAVEDTKSELNVRVFQKNIKESPFCDLCKDVMTQVESALQDPATKQKIEDLGDKVCSVLPQQFSDDCKTFLNSNIDALIDILQQELKPDNICPALKLCDASKRLQVSQRVKDLECDVCKDVVTNFRQKLANPDAKKVVLTFLEEGCARLPGSLSQECRTFVDENIDTVMGMMIQELDPDTVCTMLKFCPSSLVKQIPKKVNDFECEVCKQVVVEVQNLIQDNSTKTAIESALDKVCSYLPTSWTDKCKSLVDKYTPMFIMLLEQELDPDMVCEAMKVCPVPAVIKVEPKKVKDVECDLCKEVVTKVEDMIKDKKTEDEIQNALDKVCTYLPSSVADKCKTFVDTYTQTLIMLLMQELTPDMICAEMKLCPTLIKEKPKKFKDLECDLCKELIGKVEDMVKNQKTKDEIQAALDKVCSYFPSSMSAKCTELVDKYTQTIITLLMIEMNPDMICAAMNVCPTKVGYPEWKSKAKDLECQGCQYALHFLQEQLSNNDTQAQVKNLIKKMCDVLPETFSKNCEAFVDQYGAAFLVLIAQEIDPSKLCYELQMCSNQTKMFQTATHIMHPFNTDECSVCTTVVDYLDKLIEEDDVDKEITKLVEKVCTVLPTSYVDKCKSIIETYGSYILQMIGQVADSKEVCQEIDLCSRPAGHVHLVGGNKCTFGPSYWCKSSAHASACKAESFCSEKVWKN